MVYSQTFYTLPEWSETLSVLCDGERISVRTNSYTTSSITAPNYFDVEFNLRSDGGRIGQLTNGEYLFGSSNRFNFIGDDFNSLNYPTSSIPRLTGFHNFDNNISTVFGTFKLDQNSADPINPAIYWENNLEIRSKLLFLYKNSTGGGSTITEMGTILDNGNWGIGAPNPNSKLEILGGLYISDQSTTLTAPDGFIYANGGIFLGNETFISSIPNNVFIATQPGTRTALGLDNPYAFLHVHSPTTGTYAGLDDFKLTDQTTGDAATDGFSLNINGSNVDIINYENGSIRFGTNGSTKLRIESNGDFLPTSDNTINLGSGTLRFNEIFGYNGVVSTSDIRLKKNIQPLKYGLKDLMKLSPITYEWKVNGNGTRIGFSAQEVEKIIPEIIVKNIDSSGNINYGIRYSELIPIIINAIVEQQLIIDNQNQIIEKLEANISNNYSNNKTNKGILFQNKPNPFYESSEIPYYVESGFQKASIIIININTGEEIYEFNIDNEGFGKTLIPNSLLAKGIYSYILKIDGSIISSKKMIKN